MIKNTTIQRPRLYMLDGFRGVCAIALMFYHLFAWGGDEHFQIGTFGVYLFYVLSGFSMWYVYSPRLLRLDMLKLFFVARVARIFPLYFLVCLIAVAARLCSQGTASFNMALLHRFLLNITFLFGFDDPGKTSIMPGGWSIGIEWVFYFLFPMFLLFVRRLSTMFILLAVGIILNLVTTGLLFADGQTLEAQWMPYTQFPTFFVYFIAGITAAEIFMRLHSGGFCFSPAVNAWMCRIVPIAALALIFFYPSHNVEDYLRGFHVVVLVFIAMAALIAGSFLENITGLEVRIYSFLGEISYSTYLLFFFVYSAVQALFKHFYPHYPEFLFVMTSTTTTLLLSYILYRFYEMPARRFLKGVKREET